MNPSPNTAITNLRPEIGGTLEAVDLEMDRQGFIGLRAAPVVEVNLQADDIPFIPIEELLKNKDTLRAGGAGYSRSSLVFGKKNYSCQENGHEMPVDQRLARKFEHYLDAESAAARIARDTVLRNYEKRVAALLFNATTWTGSALTTGITNEWDDFTNAVPVDDVAAARDKVYDGSGVWPDTLIISRKVFNNLRRCDQIKSEIEASGAGDSSAQGRITVQQLATVFDLPKILVAGGSKNSANEGQSATVAQVWGLEYAMVCKTADPGDDITVPCVARTFHWGRDGSEVGAAFDSYYEPQSRADIMRARHDTDEVVLMSQLGHLLSNVTT